jgi:hypothetical protein
MTRAACGVMVVCVLSLAGPASAQAVYVPNQWEDRPNTEIGGTLSVVTIFGPGPAGVRVTRRMGPWVSAEVSADRQREPNVGLGTPAHRLLIGAVRVSAPFDPRRGPNSITEGPGSVFLSVGAARARGLPWRVSPMVSLGLQSAYVGERLAVRVEYQRFTRAAGLHRDRARLMISAVLGLTL